MSRSSFAPKPRRSGRRLILFVPLAIAIALLLRVGQPPTITIEPSLPAVGPSTPVDVRLAVDDGRGLAAYEITVHQGDRVLAMTQASLEPRPFWAFWGPKLAIDSTTLDVGRAHLGELQPGTVTVTVTAERAATPLRRPDPVVVSAELPVDLEAPTLSIRSDRPVVRQGGSGVIVYQVDDSAVGHGVRVGDHVFPGSPLPDQGAGIHFALYGAPHDLAADARQTIQLFAEDGIGNRVERPFLSRYDAFRFPKDTIRLSDGFFAEVLPEIFGRTPSLGAAGDDPLADYLRVNRELRRDNAETLAALAQDSAPDRLWSRPFLQLPSSRVMAVYGDHRTYAYNGEGVDEQTHLGYDLASRRQAEVPSAATGRVVLADYHGIYGNTVVVDHGHGLQSLYSHLTDITVTVGDAVERGTTVGTTGTTGLAGGDHLHFSVLIHGLFVDPIEWWDRRWIETRIAGPLGFELAR
ncbi:MAG: M23 family metallopeptidase [Acidobacteriota bacterium]